MRTVPTLCASSAGLGIASIGLAVVREETSATREPSPNPPPSHTEMTALAAYPQADVSSPFTLSTPPARTTISEGSDGKARSGSARVGQKRTLTPRASYSAGMDRPLARDDDGASHAGTPQAQPSSWLRRLSSSMSASRDSSRTPTSRPGSAAISQSNGSVAFSYAGSTTPMFPDNTPPALPPNKLVKRSPSVRSANGSPFPSSASRLPIPVFRRPATSHQRSVTLQERYSGTDQSDHMSIDGKDQEARDPEFLQYFVPKLGSDELAHARRRSSSGIPNPIKRVYPDRKYTPVLVSARHIIKPAQAEVDDGLSIGEDSVEVTKLSVAPSYASSPLPAQSAQFAESQPPRRSFSIGDLLSTGPQPLWKRPSQNRGKLGGSKLVRKGRSRVVSAPQADMGSVFSRSNGSDSERPAKRRDLTDPGVAQRSIYSSTSSKELLETESKREIHLNLGADSPQLMSADISNVPFADTPPHAQTPPLLEQRNAPLASTYSATVRPARVSAAQSEITSTIGSESESRSIGDASTDYQNDTPYDSYPTRTTHSSSGRRKPHIETIFDESPPNYSSGRSTRLKDLLNDGAYFGDERGARYRHSTIEEEESIVSTPVRSLHDKSVTSTPSARPRSQQHFTSSPPVIPDMPDPDDIDWDALDDEPMKNDGDSQHLPQPTASHFPRRSLPFRFGPALEQLHSGSADITPQRPNGGTNDRANLFEWSEVQPSPSNNNSPPRPRTVHGKKDQEGRGSRPAGRRAPSGIHARSHSVPVVPDLDGKRNNVVANKFGTWGVGSKAVTEDWNEDFDFDFEEAPEPLPDKVANDEKRVDSGHVVFVPKSIREQQDNVVANIGLLREWGLLIEELKELRMRAVSLHMLDGPYAQAWQEVDAMIELADQETEEATLEPRRSPPSSPGFDYNAFDEPLQSISQTTRQRRPSLELPGPLQLEEDVTGDADTALRPSTPPHNTILRPRKDSEAVARSVIEAVQSRRSVSEPGALNPVPQSKKVPFDTATLRHIVPYVKDLQRKVKHALRETEGLYSSPRRRTSRDSGDKAERERGESSLWSTSTDLPSENFIAWRKSRRDQAATDHDAAEGSSQDQPGDLAKRMKNMNLP